MPAAKTAKKLTVTNIFMENRVLLHYALKWFFYIF
jgi:hypothetical protein